MARTSTVKSAPPEDRKRRLGKIIEKLNRAHPDAKLDLNFSNPLELLVALILAAQARDDLVNQITADVFKKYRSAEDYARASLSKLEEDLRRINFYRNKARSVQNCCKEIVARFQRKVPENLDDLLALPGVGRKTANIVLGNAFGKQTIGVDTHVMRLSQRLGLTSNTDADKIEFDLIPLVPEKLRVRFCHLLQYHGRRVCLAKKPRCPECVINSLCPYPDKTKASHEPNKD
ncbi:MAG: endonuclease III [Deltaproteobacteria bacterium]|nr:endonuclease III [Deltaproteobacteria bacterium]